MKSIQTFNFTLCTWHERMCVHARIQVMKNIKETFIHCQLYSENYLNYHNSTQHTSVDILSNLIYSSIFQQTPNGFRFETRCRLNSMK